MPTFWKTTHSIFTLKREVRRSPETLVRVKVYLNKIVILPFGNLNAVALEGLLVLFFNITTCHGM